MSHGIVDLARARVLVSNDDGVHAPGLKLLEKCMRRVAREVWVVAPETEQSAASHSLTLRRPLRVRQLSGRRYGVDGTPTDAVLLAVNEIMKDKRPDLVVSGVNRGANLGEDVTYSGTVAAAMEGALLGIPSIAFSQLIADGHPVKWATAEHFIEPVTRALVGQGWPRGILINVNFPDISARAVTGMEVTRQGRRKLGGELARAVDPRGEPYYWIGPQRSEQGLTRGTDIGAVNRGAISITPVGLDLTHRPTLRALREALR
jgi:5'-nucleotidase